MSPGKRGEEMEGKNYLKNNRISLHWIRTQNFLKGSLSKELSEYKKSSHFHTFPWHFRILRIKEHILKPECQNTMEHAIKIVREKASQTKIIQPAKLSNMRTEDTLWYARI